MNSIVFVGYTTGIWDETTVSNGVVGPQLPANYKSEEAIAKWTREKYEPAMAQWAETAAWLKLTGRLSRVFAFDVSGVGAVFDSDKPDPNYEKLSPGARFVLWLKDRYDFRKDARYNYGRGDSVGVSVYGFDSKVCMRIAGLNAIRDGVDTPLGLWYANDECYDPQEMLLEPEVKKMVSLQKLLDEAPGEPVQAPKDYEPHCDPKMDVRVAVDMCFRYQLVNIQEETPLLQAIGEGLGSCDQEQPDGDETVETKTTQTEEAPASSSRRRKASRKAEKADKAESE